MSGVEGAVDPAECIERAHWDFWWTPDDARVVDRPEIAFLSCDRPVEYLNTVYRTRAEPDRAEALVAEVLGSADHGRFRWMITDTWDGEAFADEVVRLGFARGEVAIASALRPAEWEAAPEHRAEVVADMDGLLAAVTVQQGGFGRDSHLSPQELEHYLEGCTAPGSRVRRVVVYDADGSPMTTGGLNLFPELSFALLWGGATLPEKRGRGAYTACLDRRVRLARDLGLEWVGMYAMEHSSAPIVKAHGFRDVGRMRYLRSFE